MSVIVVKELRKTFVKGFWRKRHVALRGASFVVEPGEIFGFLGPNGAGKTTTLKILMGLIKADSGDAMMFGKPCGDPATRRRVGYLPESPYFYDHLTANELLDMMGALYGIDVATRRARARKLLERVGIAHAAKRPLRSYSKGMLQRAGLAQALIAEPELVVLDEPMSGLDPIGRREVRDMIAELRSDGTTVLVCTHVLADAVTLCDRVGIVVGGVVRDQGLLSELLSPKILRVDVLLRATAEAQSTLHDRFVEVKFGTTAEGTLASLPSQEGLNEFLAACLSEGAEVLQVTPHKETLESLFIRQAQEGMA